MEIRYYYPIKGNVIVCYYVVLWAVVGSLCEWIYSNIALISGIGFLIALGLMAFHAYVRVKNSVNLTVAVISGFVSEISSMLYLLLCIVQAVDYIHDDRIFGFIPLLFTTPFTFGAWLIIKQPSLVATVAPSNKMVIGDGVVTLAFVVLFCWLFKLSGYMAYLM